MCAGLKGDVNSMLMNSRYIFRLRERARDVEYMGKWKVNEKDRDRERENEGLDEMQ